MFVVAVTFEVQDGQMGAFLPLMLENAKLSKALEPECHQFDVCTDPTMPNTVFLYEVYQNSAAFDAHLAMDHFKSFAKATDHMIADKRVETYAQVVQ